MSVNAEEEFDRASEVEWLPTGPSLEQLDWDEYAELLSEVAAIDAEATEQTGH